MKIGWSEFALSRNKAPYTFYSGPKENLIEEIIHNWSKRKPGKGRIDCEKVIVVPVDPCGFVSPFVLIENASSFNAILTQRQDGEDKFIKVTAEGPTEKINYAYVVLYSAETLLENGGKRSGDYDWEIVSLIASPIEDEPMNPLAMARNMLEKVGGTYCEYSAKEFAEAIWYWSKRCSVE